MKKIFAAILLSTCLLTNSNPFSHFLGTVRMALRANRPSLGVKIQRNAKKYQGRLVSTSIATTTISTALALMTQREDEKPFLSEDKALQHVVASLSSGL